MAAGLGVLLLLPPASAAGVPRHPAAPAGSVRVTLRPGGATSVPQGRQLTVKATASNDDPAPATVDVVFQVEPQAGGTPVDFYSWDVVVPGMGSQKISVTVITSQWFADIGTFLVTPFIDGVPAGDALAFDVLAPTVTVPQFEDVTAAAGLDTVLPDVKCSRFGAGAAWGDADGDGLLDLYVPTEGGPSQLWIQDSPGHFTDQAVDRGVTDPGRIGMGAVFADVDNDGDQDLYVVNDGPNRLYQNDGTGHFTDVAVQAGVADPGAGPSATWGDYDSDGYLDLYVTNYTDCGSSNQPDKLFHNEGDGTFTDQTALLGSDSTIGVGYQAAWFDEDGDGDSDLYLANDKLPQSQAGNHLWRNDGPGPGDTWLFSDVSAESGTNWVMASMGIGLSDFDRDLDVDFAVSNIQGNVLARNNGDGTFTDVATDVGVARPFQHADLHAITWGLGFYDLNLDGWEDLFVAAGSISDTTPQPNELFVADGRRRFLDLSAPSHADDPGVSRGVAFADYDRDGRVDLYVLNQSGRPRLYRNVTPLGAFHWLEVKVVGTVSNRDGCGARLVLTAGTANLLRQVSCGSISLASGADTAVHFGLGAATTAKLVITWPSGARQVLRDVAADQVLTVTEPSARP